MLHTCPDGAMYVVVSSPPRKQEVVSSNLRQGVKSFVFPKFSLKMFPHFARSALQIIALIINKSPMP
jgi:hypothetical protein